ncbi:hypothetical protein DKG34_23330 [Streptomyces sp. NWU49]|uniref:hemerythrin domain-containing protein n=1 Tax=Streptomyces sp. NWU49 TaxID=2201153 RepID=UPI000D67ADC3|nr:hemerythrin domain-containing protein [Streptomyces sp. NWU49]PWJ05224.1 hypothetical protein DKG34_23330 [Streptomyces sp. NWU49]
MPKTIKDQTVEQLGGTSSILVRQRREHEEMDRLMDQYRSLDDLHQRERVLKQVVQLVFSHAFAEETVLWPAVRASIPDGEELTARVEEEHQRHGAPRPAHAASSNRPSSSMLNKSRRAPGPSNTGETHDRP